MTKRTTKTYPLEFKQSSAKLAVESEQSIAQTAKDLGVSEPTLYSWVSKYHPNRHKAKDNNDMHEENKQLRRDVIRLKQERDILKKAAAYFASEM